MTDLNNYQALQKGDYHEEMSLTYFDDVGNTDHFSRLFAGEQRDHAAQERRR